MDREKIEKEAKQILDKFGRAIEKIKFKTGKEKDLKSKTGGFREEGDGNESDNNFRKRMLDNAPSKNEDCIIAEKKNW
jgi:hypothetical protein